MQIISSKKVQMIRLTIGFVLTIQIANANEERMAWWREARFGMFIHWGLYSVAGGEWQGTRGGMIASWLQHELQIPPDQYAATLTPGFTAANYDPSAWAALAKRAGMKYAVLTAKHHEGFSLFDSQYSTFNVMNSPAGRDVMGEYLTAFRAAGLKTGLYYSMIDWHHPEYPVNDGLHPMRNNATYLAQNRSTPDYVDFMHDQVEEIVTGYGSIDILWWDFSYGNLQGEAWRATELEAMVRLHQPQIIMNNRLFALPNNSGDFLTPEQYIPPTGLPGLDWETCMTINDTWGYKPHDLNFKSSTVLIRNLVDIVSKGGNYLLNIGPRPDGSIPEPLVERLNDIGDWMDVNSDAIYGTTASPFSSAQSWGRVTRKDIGDGKTKLFLQVFDWPETGEIVVPPVTGSVYGISMLNGGAALTHETDSNGTTVQLPAEPSHPAATVLVMVIDTPQPSTANAHYRMGDDGVGTASQPLDSSPNKLNFLNSLNNPTIMPNGGGYGNDAYYSFNGINQGCYDIGYDLPEDNIGIELWVRTSDTDQINRNVFSTGSDVNGLQIGYDGRAGQGGWFGAIASVAYVGTVGTENYTAGEWIHLALVREAGTTTFYVNGIPSGTSTAVPIDATLPHMAVKAGGLESSYFGGDISEARIFTFQSAEFNPSTSLLLEPDPFVQYAIWAANFPALSTAAPDEDSDGDGLPDGIEYVVGGNPTVKDFTNVGPSLDITSDPDNYLFSYRLSPFAKADTNATINVLYSIDLINWTAAEHDPEGTGLKFTTTPMNAYDEVTLTIPKGFATDTPIFMSLQVVFGNTPN